MGNEETKMTTEHGERVVTWKNICENGGHMEKPVP